MEEKEGSDWKVRQDTYDNILKQMSDPTPQLLQQLQTDLPKYLADVNPNCLRVALSICDLYFSNATSINYSQIARILIDKSFTTNRQANAEAATALLLKCIHHSHDSVLNYVYDELNSKSPKIVRAMISLLGACINEFGNADANAIVDHLSPLLDHRDQAIRKEANAVIQQAKSAPSKPHEQVSSQPIQSPPHSRPKSPAKEVASRPIPEPARRNRSPVHKKLRNTQSSAAIWSSWVSKSTLELLKHPKWSNVLSGFEELKKQYTEDNGNPSACVYGLTTLFVGRTFTLKVMLNLLNDILFYIKEDKMNLTDDSIAAILHFVPDKITDKKLESQLYEMTDIVCELMTPPYVFQAFYQHLSAKNYAVPAQLCNYFSHVILTFGDESKLNPDEVAEKLKPLCNHSDPNVRKAAIDCIAALAAVFGESVLDGFHSLKSVQLNDIKKQISSMGTIQATRNTIQRSGSPKRTEASPPKKKNESPPASRVANTSLKPKNLEAPQSNNNEHKPPMKKQRTLPVPKNYSQPVNNRDEFIPSRLVQIISRTSNTTETRKACDELEDVLNRALELRGPSSVKLNEFTSLFSAMTPWFTESSIDVVSSISKVLLLSLKLIDPNDMKNIDVSFVMDSILLLNYQEKQIKNNTVSILNEFNSKIPDFIQDFILEQFNQLNPKGKKSAVIFIRDLNFIMTVQPFLQFMISIMSDKDEELREAASMLIQKFIQLPNAVKEIKETVEHFKSTKKNQVLAYLNSKEVGSYFLQKPTMQQKEHRETKIDCFLPLKIMNASEKPSPLTEKVEHYCQRFFNLSSDFSSTNQAVIEEISSFFLNAAESEFESISFTLDIIFLWWVQLALSIDQEESFSEIFKFMLRLLSVLDNHQRKLDEFEMNLILPIVLECVGRGYLDENCAEIETLVFELSPTEFLIPSLVMILGKVASVNALQADFNALLELIPKYGLGNTQADLINAATRLHSALSNNPSKNPDLYQTSVSFIEFLKKKGFISSTLESRPISRCNLSTKISAKLKQPSILVYQWIVDLSSQDTQVIIQALKAISQQLKAEPNIFEPHLEALIVSLITSVHTYFQSDPPQNRLCKYIAFCLLTLFNETTLKNTIPQIFVQQLVYEMLTHLSNGINETVLNQVLNALIVKLINDCTMYAFVALLSAINEFNNDQFTERWIRLALKCFEACGNTICDMKNEDNICESLLLVNQMLTKNRIDELESSAIGTKIIGILKTYVNLVFEKFGDVANSKEFQKKLSSDAEIYKLIDSSVIV